MNSHATAITMEQVLSGSIPADAANREDAGWRDPTTGIPREGCGYWASARWCPPYEEYAYAFGWHFSAIHPGQVPARDNPELARLCEGGLDPFEKDGAGECPGRGRNGQRLAQVLAWCREHHYDAGCDS